MGMMSPDLQLEQLLKVLVDRFGATRTLGEVYATTYALRVCREGRSLTVADIAHHTGISKQNLSRWVKVHIDTDHVVPRPDGDDGRKYNLEVTRLDYACRHLPAVAEIFDCPLDSPRAST